MCGPWSPFFNPANFRVALRARQFKLLKPFNLLRFFIGFVCVCVCCLLVLGFDRFASSTCVVCYVQRPPPPPVEPANFRCAFKSVAQL